MCIPFFALGSVSCEFTFPNGHILGPFNMDAPTRSGGMHIQELDICMVGVHGNDMNGKGSIHRHTRNVQVLNSEC